jgi:hypothetical protein
MRDKPNKNSTKKVEKNSKKVAKKFGQFKKIS